ncbi:MAG: hypothetical protein OXG81_10970 [Acidobacteria bacterium]|nr:hypothetical protein [Acidobacteriota bacterium]
MDAFSRWAFGARWASTRSPWPRRGRSGSGIRRTLGLFRRRSSGRMSFVHSGCGLGGPRLVFPGGQPRDGRGQEMARRSHGASFH